MIARINKEFLLSIFLSPISHWIPKDVYIGTETVDSETRLAGMECRVRRNCIPNEHRERIVRAFEDPHEDYLLVADMLGVNRSTAQWLLMSEKEVLMRDHVAVATM